MATICPLDGMLNQTPSTSCLMQRRALTRRAEWDSSQWRERGEILVLPLDGLQNAKSGFDRRAELLASLTQDMGKIVGALHNSKLGGQSDIANGINIAQVSLLQSCKSIWLLTRTPFSWHSSIVRINHFDSGSSSLSAHHYQMKRRIWSS